MHTHANFDKKIIKVHSLNMNSMGKNSIIILKVELQSLLFAYPLKLKVLYVSPKFCETSYRAYIICILKLTNGYNSIKNVDGVM